MNREPHQQRYLDLVKSLSRCAFIRTFSMVFIIWDGFSPTMFGVSLSSFTLYALQQPTHYNTDVIIYTLDEIANQWLFLLHLLLLFLSCSRWWQRFIELIFIHRQIINLWINEMPAWWSSCWSRGLVVMLSSLYLCCLFFI